MISKGAKIAAISPSGIHNPIQLEKSIALVNSWGFEVVCSPNHRSVQLYTAGSLEQRLNDFKWALKDSDIELIWIIRGGYGSAQLLPYLGKLQISKPVVGFSDATALLCYLWNSNQTVGFHGPVLHSLESLCDSASQNHVREWLSTGRLPTITGRHLLGPSNTLQAPIVGGNLCVLASLCGTPYQLQSNGCILALEDIAEPAYKIDRLLYQLQMSGQFDNIKGILLGSFHNCVVPSNSNWGLEDVFKERLTNLNIPVFHNAKFGHDSVNWIWKFGNIIQLDPNVA